VGISVYIFISITLWSVTNTSLALILGSIGFLNLPTIVLVELILATLGSVLLLSSKEDFVLVEFKHALSEHHNVFIIILILLSLVAVALLQDLMLTTIKEHDSTFYHLPSIATWYQTGQFRTLEMIGENQYFTYSWEALCSLFVFAYRGDFLVALPNLVAWVLLGLSIYIVARLLGAERTHGLIATSLVLTLPNVLQKVNNLQIDLALAASFAAGCCAALLFAKHRQPIYLLLLLASIGMVAGIKPTGLVYGLLAAFVFFIANFKASQSGGSSFAKRRTRVCTFIGALLLVFIGGFWYVKNLVEAGNPFGLYQVKLLGFELFDGPIKTSQYTTKSLAGNFDPLQWEYWKILWTQTYRYLALPFLALVLMSALSPLLLFRADNRSVKTRILTVLSFSIVLLAVYWFTPYSAGLHAYMDPGQINENVGRSTFRYAFPFFASLGVTAALMATATAASRVIIALPAILASASFLSLHGRLTTVLIAVGLLWAVISGLSLTQSLRRLWSRRAIRVAVTAVIITAAIAILPLARKVREQSTNRWFWGIHEYLDTNLQEGEPVGMVSSRKFYGLYGKRLDITVKYLPPEIDSADAWIEKLRSEGVRVIGYGPIGGVTKTGIEYKWLEDPNGRFERVLGQDPTHQMLLYKLKDEDIAD